MSPSGVVSAKFGADFFTTDTSVRKRATTQMNKKIGVVVAVVDLNFQTNPKFDATAKELFSMEIKMS